MNRRRAEREMREARRGANTADRGPWSATHYWAQKRAEAEQAEADNARRVAARVAAGGAGGGGGGAVGERVEEVIVVGGGEEDEEDEEDDDDEEE